MDHQYVLPPGLRKAVQDRKGPSPKEAEAQGFPGHTANSCMTVAFAECYAECYQIHPIFFSRTADRGGDNGWILIADARIGYFLLPDSSSRIAAFGVS